jgi:hydroxyacylglutathione hydrolase
VTGNPIDLAMTWNVNPRGSSEPPIQVHRVSADTVILRQSLAVSYEAPFLYLLFGGDRALLLDTGATASPDRFPLRATVDGLIDEWLAVRPAPRYGLVVAHSHAHGDHIAGDAQFADRPNTEIVSHDPAAVAAFFGIGDWPSDEGRIDLGGRLITVLAIPGHQAASIALYDAQTELLLTGDTVYPGRLYVRDAPAFAASIDRLCAFADRHPVSAILGAHIESSRRRGHDFPLLAVRHPDEASLPMTVEQLLGVRDAVAALEGKPGAHRFPDFAIWIGDNRLAIARQLLRALGLRLTRRG